MKNFSLVLITSILCLIFLCCGCFGPKNKRTATEFYTLNYDAPAPVAGTPLNFSISVEPFDAIPPYDSTRMIYATSLFTVSAYAYHEWIAYPSEIATFLFARDLRNSGIVQSVMVGDYRYATHRMMGRVESFCEQDQEDGWHALLSVSITLVKLNETDITKIICLQKNYTLTEPCPQKNPKGLAIAMSSAMSKISLEIISDIRRSLSY
ncbi:MAG: PqiC family protein [Desulfobacterales bacterium]|jgi:ABC-type uncharacterized transport system auxiliary subunit|nr:PqiC family protein [Desulfobacterales bacterium]